MPIYHNYLPLLLILCFALLTGACTKNNAVKLNYTLGPTQTACAGEVVVFKFEDARKATRLGKDSDGRIIDTLSDVADWVGWALFDELRAAGCDPKYRTTTVTPGELPLITGQVLEVALNQTGTTTYAGKIVVKITIEKAGKIVHTEKFSSEVQDIVVPGYANRTDIMTETLRALMAELVPSIESHI